VGDEMIAKHGKVLRILEDRCVSDVQGFPGHSGTAYFHKGYIQFVHQGQGADESSVVKDLRDKMKATKVQEQEDLEKYIRWISRNPHTDIADASHVYDLNLANVSKLKKCK